MKTTRCYRPKRKQYINRKSRKCRPPNPNKKSKPFQDIILYPFGKGQRRRGVEQTPDLLTPILEKYTTYRIHRLTSHDLQTVDTAKRAMHRIRMQIGKRPTISVGGDHTISIGSITASLHMYPNLKIVYFDAHGDINTHESSLSKNKHGMVLSYILDQGFDPRNLIYVGIRCLDAYEVTRIEQLGISYVTPNTPNMEQKVATFVGDCPVHVSFDVDVLDESTMPWTGLPSKGGIDLSQTARIMNRIRINTVAIDIAELNLSNPR